MASRIQYQRKSGWTLPENAVYVGRGKGSEFGNPYEVVAARPDKKGRKRWVVMLAGRRVVAPVYRKARAVKLACEFFEWYLQDHPAFVARIREVLKGKDLACWCKPGARCHGDTLLRVANSEGEIKPDEGVTRED